MLHCVVMYVVFDVSVKIQCFLDSAFGSKDNALRYFEMSAPVYQSTRHDDSQDFAFYQECYENMRYLLFGFIFIDI
jgi:hypothetical protein